MPVPHPEMLRRLAAELLEAAWWDGFRTGAGLTALAALGLAVALLFLFLVAYLLRRRR